MKIFNLNEIDVKIKSEFDTFDEIMFDSLMNIFFNNRNIRDRSKNLQKKRKNEHKLNENVNIKKSKHWMNKFSFMKIELKKIQIANKIITKKSIQKLKNTKQYKWIFENEKINMKNQRKQNIMFQRYVNLLMCINLCINRFITLLQKNTRRFWHEKRICFWIFLQCLLMMMKISHELTYSMKKWKTIYSYYFYVQCDINLI